jgi:hypothetical protein
MFHNNKSHWPLTYSQRYVVSFSVFRMYTILSFRFQHPLIVVYALLIWYNFSLFVLSVAPYTVNV